MRRSATGEAFPGGVLSGRTPRIRPWVRWAPAWCCAVVLLWACYDYGAFLNPSRPATAIAVPALGLIWALSLLLTRRRDNATQRRAPESGGRAPAAERRAPTATGPRPGLVAWSLLALAVSGTLSAAWSLDRVESLVSGGILFGGLVFLYVGQKIGGDHRLRASALLFVATVGVIESLLGIAGFALRYWRFAVEQDGALAATGTFGYANALAGLLLLTLACTGALWLEIRELPTPYARLPRPMPARWRAPLTPTVFRVLIGMAAALQVAALVLTRSRAAGAIAAALVLLFVIVRAFRVGDDARHRRLGIGLTVLLLCALVAGGVLIWREVSPQLAVSGLPPSDAEAGTEELVPMTSNSFRLKTWAAALEAFHERPVAGYGLGTFYEAYSPFKLGGHTAYAHNVVVQHLVEVGTIGTLLLLAFLVIAVTRPMKAFADPSHGARSLLLLGALAFALHNLVDLTWYFPALFYTFTLVLGLMARPPLRASAPPLDGTSSAPVVCSKGRYG